MWKIKLTGHSEESLKDSETVDSIMKKTDKNGGGQEQNANNSQKKLKQARLPFHFVSSQSSVSAESNDDEKSIKKRKLSSCSIEHSKSKLLKTEVKENVCENSVFDDIIVIDDDSNSVDKVSCILKTKDKNISGISDINEDLKPFEAIVKEKTCNTSVKNYAVEDNSVDTESLLKKKDENNSNLCDSIIGHLESKLPNTEVKESFSEVPLINDIIVIDDSSAVDMLKSNKIIKNSENSVDSFKNPKKRLISPEDDEIEIKSKSPVTRRKKCKLFPKINLESNSKKVDHIDEVQIQNKNLNQSSNINVPDENINLIEEETKKYELEKNESNSESDCNSLQSTQIKTKKIIGINFGSNNNCKMLNENNENHKSANTISQFIKCTKSNDDSNDNSSSAKVSSEKGENIDIIDNFTTPKRSPNSKVDAVSDNKSTPESIDTSEDENDNSERSFKIDKTPKRDKKRQLTPKQLLKRQESEKKKQEKENIRLEKERLRKEKEDQINHQKQERKRQKLEKEEAKKREKEEKEKKRLKEIELKNEEKKAKEEERKAKEEERKKREEAKEEEKRKRDEAKEEERKKKESEKRKEEKAASAFANFFTPKRVDNKSSDGLEDGALAQILDNFMPFEVKADMRLAATHRRLLGEENKKDLDNALEKQDLNLNDLYINKLKSKQHTPLEDGKTWPLDDSEDVMIIESEIAEENNQQEKKINSDKKNLPRPRAKLIQFHENRRPPYWGTWRKKSSVIGPRKPFGQDNAIFEYEVDSDDEWEEEEPGESLHGSDDEKESEDEYEVDNKLFVPHGYLSDEEAHDEMEDFSPEAQKAKLKFLEMEFEAEMKEKTEKLKPRLIGCVWFNNSVEDPKSVGSHLAELLLTRRAVLWENLTIPIDTEVSSSVSTSPISTPAKYEESKSSKNKFFPEAALPSLIKLVHGNRYKHKFIVEEFHEYITKNSESISDIPTKKAISNMKREISEWTSYPQEDNCNHPMTGRRCWFVSKELRDKYGLLDHFNTDEQAWNYTLEVPRYHINLNTSSVSEQSPTVTPITKFTKILSHEERQKQLTTPSKPQTSSCEKQSTVPVQNKKKVLQKKTPLLDSFAKTGINKDVKHIPTIIDTIELSPEKNVDLTSSSSDLETSAVIKNTENIKVNSEKSDIDLKINDSSKTENVCTVLKPPVTSTVPKKRITPIRLSPIKTKKK